MDQNLAPVHPGEILSQEFLLPMGMSQYRLAKDIFGTSDIFWLNLQARYDLDVQKQRLGKRLREIRSHSSRTRSPAAAYRRKTK